MPLAILIGAVLAALSFVGITYFGWTLDARANVGPVGIGGGFTGPGAGPGGAPPGSTNLAQYAPLLLGGAALLLLLR